MIGAVNNRPLRAEAIFAQKKIYFEKFSKTEVVSITLRLRQIHGQSLKEVGCSKSNATHHC